MQKMLVSLFFLLTVGSLGCTGTANSPLSSTDATGEPISGTAIDPILGLSDGWTKIEPGGKTRCAHDTEYAFWVRPGSVNKLLVYFQGGGGCWSGDTCQKGSSLYDASITDGDTPVGRIGIFDFENPQNPFADYHAVYVPYCTGDVHMGGKMHSYETSSGDSITVYHYGFINASSALEWTYANVLAPDSIFITGCSAGSAGSIHAAPHLMHHYPEATISQLGDSLGFIFDQPSNADTFYGMYRNFPDWIPAIEDFDPNAFLMADFYNTVAAYYPQHRFAQFNTERDSVQVRYHVAGGDSADTFVETLAADISTIHAVSSNFYSYTADGDGHCIMPYNGFYHRQVNGVSFRDWVADLAEGKDVENVQCEGCKVVYGE